eukprot:CAMPEP_0181220012 /NCGR_PEP_ID=MMETSP1096-20121128/28604_1 /TAXON_ID=156174 ORGANISM="Chrysochromulina ericina, Strain CCMP281" /NCGR_SAMPLE_ID=MMETSP1096 /ASSEMBLY_ACC=CAM_ASM_000453 /LENGTH=91 /DNA_ID=CAMNT_0023312475 /DNA_START=236 /DNA_END=512 /DNA_ORIENTATION=+
MQQGGACGVAKRWVEYGPKLRGLLQAAQHEACEEDNPRCVGGRPKQLPNLRCPSPPRQDRAAESTSLLWRGRAVTDNRPLIGEHRLDRAAH